MKNFIAILFIGLFILNSTFSQELENEIEFKYIKAKYLLDTERYEDAIKAFSEIIKEDESYNDALIQRAKAKYAMAAYKGVHKDVLQFAAIKGLTPEAITYLGMADYKMGNTDAAINSLASAVNFPDANPKVYQYLGNLYKEKELDNEACYMWKKGARLGDSKSAVSLKKECGDVVTDEEPQKKRDAGKVNGSSLPTSTEDRSTTADVDMKSKKDGAKRERIPTGGLGDPIKDTVLKHKSDMENKNDEVVVVDGDLPTEPVEEKENDNLPPDDDTPNEIVIDEDLTLIIEGQGLGKRKVLEQPNILILSEEDGVVAIDICVNKNGKVESGEFNSKRSTTAVKSLVSLAIRKSKDFWFQKNDYKEQCGVILFKIKGTR